MDQIDQNALSDIRSKPKKRFSDDAVDAIAAIALIVLAAAGVIFWLSTLPSS